MRRYASARSGCAPTRPTHTIATSTLTAQNTATQLVASARTFLSVAGSTASTRSSAHSFISRKARSARRCTVAPIPNTRSSPRPPMCHRRFGVSWCAPDALETASDDHANPAEPRSFAVEPERPVVARTETSVASVTASRAAPRRMRPRHLAPRRLRAAERRSPAGVQPPSISASAAKPRTRVRFAALSPYLPRRRSRRDEP